MKFTLFFPSFLTIALLRPASLNVYAWQSTSSRASRSSSLTSSSLPSSQMPLFSPSTTISTTINATSSSSTSIGTTASTNTNSTITIPQPFDSGYNYKLTTSCSAFFNTFLSSQDFIGCYSFGFLMIDSLGFSRLARNINNVTPLLDEICTATMNESTSQTCNNVMSNYMTKMADTSNCGADLTATPPNPEAYQAYLSFVTYSVYQAVGCLQNSTGQYCYVNNLLANKANDASLYLLPQGTGITNTTVVACSDCTQRIMITYSKYAGVANTPLNLLYTQTAQYIQAQCGAQFVPSYPVSVSSGTRQWQFSIVLILLSVVTVGLANLNFNIMNT